MQIIINANVLPMLIHVVVQKRVSLVNASVGLQQVVSVKVPEPIATLLTTNANALLVLQHAPILEKHVPRELVNVERLLRVSVKRQAHIATLQTIFANVRQLLQHAVERQTLAPQEFVNAEAQMHVVTQEKRVVLVHANVELLQPVSARYLDPFVMRLTMYASVHQL